MSKKSKTLSPPTADQARERLKRAFLEGRHQTALDLAKQLCKIAPSDEHRELLLDAALSRAAQTARQGNRAGAVELVRAYLPEFEKNAARLAKSLALLASWGEVGVVLSLRDRAPAAASECEAVIADSLLVYPQRREQAPASWQADCARVEQAFREAAEGHDDKARDTLQGIGLQSPYLEWRVLLRGLIAYYNGQDDKARENWERLNPARLPARLAAPLRFLVDPAFRDSPPGRHKAAVAAAANRLTIDTVEAQLRRIEQALNRERPDYASGLRVAAELLPELRRMAPSVAERLAHCVYWRMAREASPDDVRAYEKTFGRTADDPHLFRLKALAAEADGAPDVAHGFWHLYEEELAKPLPGWSAEQAVKARALILLHMARNAMATPLEVDLTPRVADCLRKAIKLAPDLDEARAALHDHLLGENKPAEAETVVREHLKVQPKNVSAWLALARLCSVRNDTAAALEAYSQASVLNPLDPEVRALARQARWRRAAELTERGDLVAARPLFEAALADPDRPRTGFIQALWALAEFKAGSVEHGESLLAQARTEAEQPIALAWLLVVESKRLKLKKPSPSQFTKEWKDLLARPATPRAAIDLIAYSETYVGSGFAFRGLATWDKAVQKYAASLPVDAFSDDELRLYCGYLDHREADRELGKILASAQRRFPTQAYYPYLKAVHLLRSRRVSPFEVVGLLQEAERLAVKANDQKLLDAIGAMVPDRLPSESSILRSLAEMLPGSLPGLDELEDMFGDREVYR